MLNKRVLTGMRTTGPLHLGHYVGALENWVSVQNSGDYECFFLLADFQALTTLTTNSEDSEMLEIAIRQALLDWMSVGIDPNLDHVHIVQQSQVRERYELSMLLSQIASFGLLEKNPTVKAEMANLSFVSLAFMGYPLDQVADIQMIDPLTSTGQILVPVGKDQAPHLEFARDIVRILNRDYMSKQNDPVYLTECEALIGDIGRLVGTDGNSKMSKSLGNTIMLTDTSYDVAEKIRKMKSAANDDSRFDREDEEGEHTLYGHPTFLRLSEDYLDSTEFDNYRYLVTNPVIEYALAFMLPNEALDVVDEYYKGVIRYSDTKARLTEVINEILEPIRRRRASLRGIEIDEIIRDGSKTASAACELVVESVRNAMHLNIPK